MGSSSIAQIKQQVNQIGQQAATTAGQLTQLAANLEKNIAVVNQAIGGTASGEDTKMVNAFQQASQAIKNASASLQVASEAAKDWIGKA